MNRPPIPQDFGPSHHLRQQQSPGKLELIHSTFTAGQDLLTPAQAQGLVLPNPLSVAVPEQGVHSLLTNPSAP